jgi:hypothetical protein
MGHGLTGAESVLAHRLSRHPTSFAGDVPHLLHYLQSSAFGCPSRVAGCMKINFC